jgi:hypothetical protein
MEVQIDQIDPQIDAHIDAQKDTKCRLIEESIA